MLKCSTCAKPATYLWRWRFGQGLWISDHLPGCARHTLGANRVRIALTPELAAEYQQEIKERADAVMAFRGRELHAEGAKP